MKIVFFDIDGTIYHLKTGIPVETAAALDQLWESGVIAGVCTSRSFSYIPNELKKMPFYVWITSNGARIQVGDKLIKNDCFSQEQVRYLLDVTRCEQLVPVLCGSRFVLYDEHILTSQIDPWIISARKSLGSNFRSLALYSSDIPVDKVCVKVPSDQNPEALIQLLDADPAYSLYVSRDNKNHRCCEFEVMPAPSTKGNAICQTLAYLNISALNAYAFGDGTNDLPMFEAVCNSIAMGNACEEVRSGASYVTARFDEGGIAKGLRHFGLIGDRKGGIAGTAV